MYKLHTYVRFTRQFVHPSRAGKKANERKVEGNNWYLNTIFFFGESNIGTQDKTAAWTEAIDIKSKFLDCLGIVVGPTIVWVELPQKLQCFALHLITFPLTLKPFHLSSDKKTFHPLKELKVTQEVDEKSYQVLLKCHFPLLHEGKIKSKLITSYYLRSIWS